ncbi:hypothetical protein NC652_039638 [Populus alba x Populus x berolinensis]|nr:hypothetical protein NC652_039638 [Populus alba x Populus x berolinensis]
MVHGLCFQIRSVNTAGVALLLPSMEELKTLELIKKMITERRISCMLLFLGEPPVENVYKEQQLIRWSPPGRGCIKLTDSA